jgi:hypothetical protein
MDLSPIKWLFHIITHPSEMTDEVKVFFMILAFMFSIITKVAFLLAISLHFLGK